MKKLLALLIMLAIIVIPVSIALGAENETNNNEMSIKSEFDKIFEQKIGETIQLRGMDNTMLVEFAYQEKALNKVKEKCANIIGEIKNFYGLDELSEKNWEVYYTSLITILDDSKDRLNISEGDYEYRLLSAFFDIYENKFKNDKIRNLLIYDLNAIEFTDNEEQNIEEIIAENLPYDASFSKEYFSKIEEIEKAKVSRATFNVDMAVVYASNYATYPNEPSYYYFSNGDCTNFVSQILEAGGVSQEVYDSSYSGWWHKYNPKAWFDKHTHSRSWTKADVFARYMGVSMTTNSHRHFSKSLKRGSIIGYDRQSDGDWEHMAFVTSTDGYEGSYGYYDYKVAQHTSGYNAWTSKEENHWEDIGKNGGTYGRIRG